MDQYQIDGNTLILRVKKPRDGSRNAVLFAFFSFIAPLIAIAASISSGSGLKLGFLISPLIFGLLGFYMLRLALWNTFGKEVIVFEKNSLNYIADYGWFKDGRKTKPLSSQIDFIVEKMGYEEDNKGRLIIQLENDQIKCVTVMPTQEIGKLIQQLVLKFRMN